MRKLIWTCNGGSCGGYADRLKGIVTAYLLAQHVGREFFIEWNGLTNIEDCFDVPCAFNHSRLEDSRRLRLIDKLETEQQVVAGLDVLSRIKAETAYLQVNQYDQPHCNVLGHYGESMEGAFSHVLNRLITPKPEIRYSPAYHTSVGVQVRTGEQNYPHEHGLKRIDPSEVWDCILQDGRPPSVFVASDSPAWKNDFAAVHPEIQVAQMFFTPAHIERSEPEEIRRTFVMTVIEHQVLSKCLKVYTGWGGFGRTAAWWGQKPCIDLLESIKLSHA